MTTATQTLAEFILARVGEDETEARHRDVVTFGSEQRAIAGVQGAFDPARVLAQCAAYRVIVESYLAMQDGKGAHGLVARITDPVSLATFEHVLRALSSTWSDHPDYRAGEWA